MLGQTRRGLLVGTALLVGCAAPSTTPHVADPNRHHPPTRAPDVSSRIDGYVAQFGKNWGDAFRFNGYLLVTRSGRPIYGRGFGRADEEGRPFEATTVFPIASNTKGFTAAAILRLAEQGKLDVQDRVVDHLPDYEGPATAVTIHQLLTHTAGLPSYTKFEDYVHTQSRARSVDEIVDLFRTRPLLFPPGEQFSYSNSGYALLGAIVEAASGSTYREFLAAEVIAPAGLQHTGYAPTGHCQDELPGFAVGDAERLQLDDQNTHMSNGFSAGGVRSTAADLAAWGTALLDGRVLQASSTEALFSPEQERYAYGWEIWEEDGRRAYSHDGLICGFTNRIALLPEHELVVVAWANNRDFAIDTLVRGVLELVLGEAPHPVDEPPLVELTEKERHDIVGRYQLTEQGRAAATDAGAPQSWLETVSTLVVVDREGELHLDGLGGLLSATADGALVVRSWRVDFRLERDEGGRVTKLHLRQDDISIEYARVPPAPPQGVTLCWSRSPGSGRHPFEHDPNSRPREHHEQDGDPRGRVVAGREPTDQRERNGVE